MGQLQKENVSFLMGQKEYLIKLYKSMYLNKGLHSDDLTFYNVKVHHTANTITFAIFGSKPC